MKKGILLIAMLLLAFGFVYGQTSSSTSTTDQNSAQQVPSSAQPVDTNQAKQSDVQSTSAAGNASASCSGASCAVFR